MDINKQAIEVHLEHVVMSITHNADYLRESKPRLTTWHLKTLQEAISNIESAIALNAKQDKYAAEGYEKN